MAFAQIRQRVLRSQQQLPSPHPRTTLPPPSKRPLLLSSKPSTISSTLIHCSPPPTLTLHALAIRFETTPKLAAAIKKANMVAELQLQAGMATRSKKGHKRIGADRYSSPALLPHSPFSSLGRSL